MRTVPSPPHKHTLSLLSFFLPRSFLSLWVYLSFPSSFLPRHPLSDLTRSPGVTYLSPLGSLSEGLLSHTEKVLSLQVYPPQAGKMALRLYGDCPSSLPVRAGVIVLFTRDLPEVFVKGLLDARAACVCTMETSFRNLVMRWNT